MNKLEDVVQAEIERRNLRPRPLIYFLGRRSAFWVTAVLSVVFGAVAAASAIFLSVDYYRTGGRELDEIPFDDIATYAPFAWLILLAIFAVSAQASFKETRGGYKYKPTHVIAAAFGLSTLLGTLLYAADVGGLAHRYLASNMRAYAEYTTIPYEFWSRPDQGFLGGEVIVETEGELKIRDFNGAVWQVDTTTASNMLTAKAKDEGDIAIRGHVTGPFTFKAVSVGPFD